MAGQGQVSGESISQINVTPLVDVMLVLLVIFMVTAPILQQGVPVDLPRVSGSALRGEEQQIVVAVARDGRIYLNDTPVALARLGAKVQAVLRERPGKRVFLRGDKTVSYGQVMRVMGVLRAAGVERVGLVTEPPPQTR